MGILIPCLSIPCFAPNVVNSIPYPCRTSSLKLPSKPDKVIGLDVDLRSPYKILPFPFNLLFVKLPIWINGCPNWI